MAVRVLVVDDEDDYRIIARDVLQAEGYEVDLAGDGEAGLAAVRDRRPDLVLVDWMMPKLDGEAFCRRLREDSGSRSLPVLMLTVKQTADEELEALHFGVDDFITKPFKPAELLARVRAALRRAGDRRP
ncbi:MAG: response regulator [Elusimicrobia bacterium]|nr:response regulator [Elusimicrobiota bacterium]